MLRAILNTLLGVPTAWAQFKINVQPQQVGLPGEELGALIIRIINASLILVAVVALGFLVYGGFRYITSRGDEQEVQAAKQTITYAIIGIVVIGIAAAIVTFVVGGVVGPPAGGAPAPGQVPFMPYAQ